MKAILLLCLVGLALAGDHYETICKARYGAYQLEKLLTKAEYPTVHAALPAATLADLRKATFVKNCIEIERHNANEDRTFDMGINQFTDWTQEEFESILGLKVPENAGEGVPLIEIDETQPAAAQYDLRTKGVVNSVRNQGQCGSCWAFAATASFEINHALKYGSTQASDQQVLDCTPGSSCNGGWYMDAWRYRAQSGWAGLNDYAAYSARQYQCRRATSRYHGPAYARAGGESQMTNVLQQRGAIAVAVDASSWSSYRGGVFTRSCGRQLNHAVVVVGYGNDGGNNYWIIRNSWGAGWGEQGYIRLLRGRNHCGVADQSYVPYSNSN